MKKGLLLIKKILKRTAEALTKPYFLDLTEKAYQNNLGPEHKRIQKNAQIWFGLQPTPNQIHKLLAKWHTDFTLQARNDLFKQRKYAFPLKDSLIGFENLRIHCSPTNSNSTFVYLLGFTDNIISLKFLKKYILPDTITIDIGANLGIFTAAMARYIGTKGKVIAFEPLEPIYQQLVNNIQLNKLENIETRNIGIGKEAGSFRFNSNSQDFNIGKGHLCAKGDIQITVNTLDKELKNTFNKISFIKIDTEGHELAALQGGQEILKKHKPVIMCEFNPDSYSFTDMLKAIPFKAHHFIIPDNLADSGLKDTSIPNQKKDILIIPDS